MTFHTPRRSAGSSSAGVQVDVTAPIATLEVGWPDNRDGPATEAWRALAAALTSLSKRDDVKCIVLQGTRGGAPAAQRGAADALAPDSVEARAFQADAIASALRALRASRHPIVALVEGACVGWGLEIATCCDLRVCGESSRFGAAVDASRLGGVYDELRPLAQLLGPTTALERVLDGGMLGAERAQLLGLVNRVAPDAGLREQAYGLAARVAAGAPLVNRWHKQAVRRLYGQVPLVL
ncbi:MAG: enoyl-CoA hydratase/isomerase family protein [Gemmatimonadota bacterium]